MVSSSPRVHEEEASVVSMVPRLALVMACLCLVHPAAHGAVDLYDHTPPNPRDATALRQVRAALVNTQGTLDGWEGGSPCFAPWVGVRCERGNDVTHLELPGRNFAGVLAAAVGDIVELIVLVSISQ